MSRVIQQKRAGTIWKDKKLERFDSDMEKKKNLVRKTEENKKVQFRREGMKKSGKWCRDRIGANTVPGQGRVPAARSPWIAQAVVSEQVTSHRHVLTHARFWTSVIYVRISDASHPLSSGTAGRI